MRNKPAAATLRTATLLALTLAAGCRLVGCVPARSAEKATGRPQREGIELTVYAQDFGMVRETRPMALSPGSNRLRVPDVSKELDPQSVLLKWQGDGNSLPQLVA